MLSRTLVAVTMLGLLAVPALLRADEVKPEAKREAIAKAVTFLKEAQKNGHWDTFGPGAAIGRYTGGFTALATLALLEAEVKADDKVVTEAVEYLRKIEPKDTYVVGLQTAVLCKVDPKKDAALIQRNVDWLLKTQKTDPAGKFLGWGYPASIPGADNSNTQFAVLGLDAAQNAGFKIEPEVWKRVQEYYLRIQCADGGWSYRLDGGQQQSRLTMTCAGVCGVVICTKHLKNNDKKLDESVARGLERVGESFTVSLSSFRYYNLHALGRTGTLTGKATFSGKDKERAIDWSREGTAFLIKEQRTDGSWRSDNIIDGHPVIGTSFALLFLTK